MKRAGQLLPIVVTLLALATGFRVGRWWNVRPLVVRPVTAPVVEHLVTCPFTCICSPNTNRVTISGDSMGIILDFLEPMPDGLTISCPSGQTVDPVTYKCVGR